MAREIKYRCKHCDTLLASDLDLVGHLDTCARCGMPVRVPQPQGKEFSIADDPEPDSVPEAAPIYESTDLALASIEAMKDAEAGAGEDEETHPEEEAVDVTSFAAFAATAEGILVARDAGLSLGDMGRHEAQLRSAYEAIAVGRDTEELADQASDALAAVKAVCTAWRSEDRYPKQAVEEMAAALSSFYRDYISCVATLAPTTGESQQDADWSTIRSWPAASRYMLAVVVCVAIVFAYAIVGVLAFGWQRGGGVLPMTALCMVLVGAWRLITKGRTPGKPLKS